MHDALLVHEVHGGQHLSDEVGGVLLRVGALLDNPVKQLAAGHAAEKIQTSGQVRAGQVRSGQVRAEQVTSGRVRSGE